MKLKLIVSAYVAGASHDENARETARLLYSTADFELQLVHGCYNGVREVAVELTGFSDIEHLHGTATDLCIDFNQSCVYYSIDGVGALLHRDGRHQTIGVERHFPAEMVGMQIFRECFKNYTVYADGSALAAKTTLEVAA